MNFPLIIVFLRAWQITAASVFSYILKHLLFLHFVPEIAFRITRKICESLFTSLAMEYWSRRKAAHWHVGRISLSNRVTLPDVLGLGHQGFFHIDGQQSAVGQDADTIHYLRSSGCGFMLLVSGLVVCPSLSVAFPLFCSVQWWEPLWGHEPPRHLRELWDGLPHTFPGVHGWQLEWDHEGNWDLEARSSSCGEREILMCGLFSGAWASKGKGNRTQKLGC